MSEIQLIMNDIFWKFLVSFEELKAKKDLAQFCSSLEISENELMQFQNFLKRFDVICETDDAFIYPLKDRCKIKMNFSFSEWFALQASFPTDGNQPRVKHYYEKIIQNKLHFTQVTYDQFNLYKKPDDISIKLDEIENLKKKMDHVISYKKSVIIELYNNKKCSLFPHRLVFLDGILSVIGESVNDKTLAFFGLEDVKNIYAFDQVYKPNLSQIEVNEFICHLRIINGREERLVLKVYNQYEADLLPSYHYLGNPFVTSNTEGDLIWAATLEMCDDLFEWLYSLKERAEVLDPGHVKKEFAHYCEIKNENSRFKKVS